MFAGRAYELGLLKRAIASQRAELIILYGRRRVGKSTLLLKAKTRKGDLYFEALQGVSRKRQIEHFLQQLAEQTSTPLSVARDWREAFEVLSFHISRGKHFVVLDELPWMASGRSELVSLLKYYWDNRWRRNSGLTLALCGSIASFMLKHIVHSSALHNRKTLEIKLPPLSAMEAKPFFRGLRSDFETAKFLMVFGGIPKYLEQVDPRASLADNLDRLCFQRHGFFVGELDSIFKEQFKVVRNYERIVRALAEKSGSNADLALRTGIAAGGGLSGYLAALEQADFVKAFSPVSAFGKDPKARGQKTRRLVLWDEWLRFYLTWMESYRGLIEQNTKPGLFERLTGGRLDAYFGLCFERFCMKNLPQIFEHLGMDFGGVLGYGPFFRQPSRRRARASSRGRGAPGENHQVDPGGYQIDILVRKRGDVLTLIECKLSSRPIGVAIVDEVKRKARFLNAPSRYTLERYLISAGEVTAGLRNSGYFHRIAGLDAIFG